MSKPRGRSQSIFPRSTERDRRFVCLSGDARTQAALEEGRKEGNPGEIDDCSPLSLPRFSSFSPYPSQPTTWRCGGGRRGLWLPPRVLSLVARPLASTPAQEFARRADPKVTAGQPEMRRRRKLTARRRKGRAREEIVRASQGAAIASPARASPPSTL